MRTFPFGLSYLMSPGRNDWPGGTVPFGLAFAVGELAILMLPERNDHPDVALGLMSPERSAHAGVALGMLVSARRSRSASQSIRARASTTTMKILRNEYMPRVTPSAFLRRQPTSFICTCVFSCTSTARSGTLI